MSSRKEQKMAARAARLAHEAEAAAAARRKRQLTIGAAGALATVIVVVVAAILVLSGNGTTLGPEGIPLAGGPVLAGTQQMASGNTVDGVGCLGQEQTLFHIHAHVTVFVRGAARTIPDGIGITQPQIQNTSAGPFVAGGSCFYFLHTHASDGIIHIESPVRRTYTLGDFFDIWGQRLGRREVGPATGRVTAFYDGRPYVGDPRRIPLTRHAQIQLDVGRPLVAPVRLTVWRGL